MHASIKTFLILCSSLLGPLDVGLGDVGAVDPDVDFSVVLLLSLLSVEHPSVADQVERQQEPQHAESKESNVDLWDNTRVIHDVRGLNVSVCL